MSTTTSTKDNNSIKELKLFWVSLKESFKDHKKITIFSGVLIAFLAWWGTGLLTQIIMEDNVYYDPLNCIIETFLYPVTLILWLFLCYSIGMWVMKISRLFHKGYVVDKRTGAKISTEDNTYGSAHFMNEEEKQKYLKMDKDINNIDGSILGLDEKKRVCSRDETVMFTNSNEITFGPPGSGKSICMMNNDILQAIKSGQSIVVVDTKGALYKDTAYVAEIADYDVKIFNTKGDEVQHSDACDILSNIIYDTSVVGRNKAKLAAASIANTIMENSLDEHTKKDVWFRGAKNLLRAMILVVKWDKTIPENERTFEKVYEILVDKQNYTNLEATYADIITNDHPAREAWRTYMGMAPIVKESCYGGLMDALTFMESEVVRKVLSNEEISLTAPGTKKCAYYIVISDSDRTNNVLAALFIEQLFRALTAYADSMEEVGEMRLPVTVNVLIDEAKQVGRIPMFVEKLSSLRSRGINIKTVFQDLSQVQQLYPNNEWQTVISDCTTMRVLRIGNANEFAKYISDRIGEFTCFDENESYGENVADPIHLHAEYGVHSKRGKRSLMTPQELQGNGERGLKDEELLVIINGAGIVRLNMFMWWNHPFYKLLHLDDKRTKRFTNHHTPEWSKRLYEKENLETQNKEMQKSIDSDTGMKTVSLGSLQQDGSATRLEARKIQEVNVNGRKVVKAKSLRR